ncbi:MAG: glycosyltransferase family 2 protein [Candidatus Kerfeldbacteria bacterium]|nr:glycosyltransferase family 2 protein [Candidatus Kerfeldbacteria bacterium]
MSGSGESNMEYSVIIPVFNERGNIAPLHRELVEVMTGLGKPFEIIAIDDGSTDGSAEELSHLTPLTVITFRKNNGQSAAMDAGIKHSRGKFLMMLDGDGQNPPSEIPKLLNAMITDVDIVSGWRKDRHDPQLKRILSWGADLLRKIFADDAIHDSGCTLKVYRRECFDDLSLMGEMHRFIPAMLKAQGYRIVEVPVVHRPRMHGETKYDWRRLVKGLTDVMAVWFWRKYAGRPVHLFGTVGLAVSVVGWVLLLGLAIRRLMLGHSIAGSSLPLIGVFLVLLGFQFFMSGILADILIKSHYSNGRTVYHIRNIKRQ